MMIKYHKISGNISLQLELCNLLDFSIKHFKEFNTYRQDETWRDEFGETFTKKAISILSQVNLFHFWIERRHQLKNSPVKELKGGERGEIMTETGNVPERLKMGPREGVTYPLTVDYCGNCSMPIEVIHRSHPRCTCTSICTCNWILNYLSNTQIKFLSFRFSTVSIIRSTRSAKRGWRSFCPMSSNVWRWRTTLRKWPTMRRNVRDVAAKAWWRSRRRRRW